MATPATAIGMPVRRKEDPRLISGTATYVDDINLPRQAYMALVRSPHAHARVRGVDTGAARRHPGVLAVYTGADVRQVAAPVPCGWALPGLKTPEHLPLATDRVRHVGEAVAAVVATSRAAARDAAELVRVDYEPLPAVVDPEAAARPDSPKLYDDLDSNVAFTWTLGNDISDALNAAPRRLTARLKNQRLAPIAIEPRGVVADYHPASGRLTVWSATQIPHILRTLLAALLGIPESRVRVIAPEVGGGFGSKLNLYGEELLAAGISRRLERPVKWIEERRENFVATIHGRDQIQDVEVGYDGDGRILALRAKILADLGAYHQLLTPAIPTFTGFMLSGAYRIPAIQAEVRGVFTTKTPTDAYRGAGRPEATFLVERVVDLVARALGKDPAEVRRTNFIPPDAFPYTTATGLAYDSGNYPAALDLALEKIGYAEFRREQAEARKAGRLLGVGLSSYVEICGLAPSRLWRAIGAGIGGWEAATVRVAPTGKVTVLTGTSPHGQGHETAWAQIVADRLGVSVDDVEVLHGDTDVAPHGLDTYGSRSAAVGGTAVFEAASRIREKAVAIAAHLLEAGPGDIELVPAGGAGGAGGGGAAAAPSGSARFAIRGAPQRSVTWEQVVAAAYGVQGLPEGMEPGLDATHFFDPSNFTYPFGTHACTVEVDPDTGRVRILRYVAVDDCGRVINPLLVDGQVHGGIAQGIAQALYEEVVYDAAGQLTNGSLMDYAVPTARELVPFETYRTETPSPVNPLGVKGVGEAGTIAASPAVVNAVCDALAHLGVTHIDMPLRPERVWRAIRDARAAAGKRGQPA